MITHFIAIDGGGTKTALRLTPKDPLTTVQTTEYVFGPSSLTQHGDEAISTIKQAIHTCLHQHQLTNEQVGIVIGVAGAGNPELKAKLEGALSCFPHCKVMTDAYISLIGANHAKPINCIAVGTGTVATQLDHDGQTTLYGGWGFPIGDEGGGAWIGFNAIQYLIESLESKHENTHESSHKSTYKNDQQALLTKTLTPIVGGRRDQLLTWLKLASASNYAQLAPIVLNCAEQGCRSSQGILARGTKHIERLAIKCCKNNNLDIVFLGGLSHYYQHQLPEHWQQRIIKPKGNALDGATLLARKFAGDIDE